MKENLIRDVIQGMLPYLNNAQGEKLREVLQFSLVNYDLKEKEKQDDVMCTQKTGHINI